jgi:trehalose synthase-fused probable maltokinase
MSDSNGDRPPTFAWSGPLNAETVPENLPRLLNRFLESYLPRQRWYGEKGHIVSNIEVDTPDVVERADAFITLSVAHLTFESGNSYRYFVPFVIEHGESEETIVRLDAEGEIWSLISSSTSEEFHRWLWEGVQGAAGTERFRWHLNSDQFRNLAKPLSRMLSGEQSNTNIAFGNEALIKIFRRVQPGLNPDVELGNFLTAEAGLSSVPGVLADLRMILPGGQEASIGIAQSFLAGSQDGWTWLNEQLVAAGNDIDRRSAIQIAIRDLGRVTATVHLALAEAHDPEIEPQPITDIDIDRWRSQTTSAVKTILSRVASKLPTIEHEQARVQAEALINYGERLLASLAGYDLLLGLNKTRVHGDYHLGQTLHRGDGWFVIDFEGEPARPLAERRARYSPLKDVAGMLRSLGYARAFATQADNAWTDPARTLERVFLAGYRTGVYASPLASSIYPMSEEAFASTLRPWIIDKAIYEIAYELDNRPSWLWVPIMSLFAGDE